jgi:hypothetical protein
MFENVHDENRQEQSGDVGKKGGVKIRVSTSVQTENRNMWH